MYESVEDGGFWCSDTGVSNEIDNGEVNCLEQMKCESIPKLPKSWF